MALGEYAALLACFYFSFFLFLLFSAFLDFSADSDMFPLASDFEANRAMRASRFASFVVLLALAILPSLRFHFSSILHSFPFGRFPRGWHLHLCHLVRFIG